MKNFKLILATAVLILALSACQRMDVPKPEGGLPPVEKADMASSCASANGNWLEEFGECENAGKDWCDANGGSFNECGSACRNDPKAEVCTMQCVPFCKF